MQGPRCALLSLVAAFVVSAAAADSSVVAAPHARLLEIGEGFAGSSVNVVANRRHGLFTHQQDQFVAFYDAAGFMTLGHRKFGSSTWRVARTAYRGTVADAHNSISIAVDGDGYLHVAWDHHGGVLNYARSAQPLSLTLTEKLSMTGREEGRVTYPEFYRLPGGDLLCFYRDGASGDGTLVLNRYRTREQRWQRVHSSLIDGEGRRNAYWGAAIDRSGGVHLAWIWRETPDVATNHDLGYAFSPDGGSSWRSIAGERLQTPLTAASSPYALRIDMQRNLMNAPWITTDEQGRPYIVSYWSEAARSAPQFRVVYHDGRRWQVEQITHRAETFELAGTATRRPPISRGVLVVRAPKEGDTAAHLIYRDDARGGRAVLLSTAKIGSAEWHERLLTRGSLGAWEPVIDPVQWERHRELHVLMQHVEQRDGDDAAAAALGTPVYSLIVDPSVTANPTEHLRSAARRTQLRYASRPTPWTGIP